MRKTVEFLVDPPFYTANSADVCSLICIQNTLSACPMDDIVDHGDETESPAGMKWLFSHKIQAIKESPKEPAPGVDGFSMDNLYQSVLIT